MVGSRHIHLFRRGWSYFYQMGILAPQTCEAVISEFIVYTLRFTSLG